MLIESLIQDAIYFFALTTVVMLSFERSLISKKEYFSTLSTFVFLEYITNTGKKLGKVTLKERVSLTPVDDGKS